MTAEAETAEQEIPYEAVSFVITTYWKLRKGFTGITNMSSRRMTITAALDWILENLPDEAWQIVSDKAEGSVPGDGQVITKITIDWSKVPGYVRNPKLPARRR